MGSHQVPPHGRNPTQEDERQEGTDVMNRCSISADELTHKEIQQTKSVYPKNQMKNQFHFTTMKNLSGVSPRTCTCKKKKKKMHTYTQTKHHLKYLKCNHRMHYKAVSLWKSHFF